MSRPPEGPDPKLLFDLPLDPVADDTAVEEPHGEGSLGDGDGDGDGGEDQVALTFAPEDEPPDRPRPIEAPTGPRFTAAALDTIVLVAVLGFSLLALRLLEVPIDRLVIAPLAVFLAAFSFLYQVMPLAFWSHTPGMAYARIHSRAKSGEFMTIQQCVLRWIGWVLTLATGGLAGLIALSGVSLSDLLSGTRSYVRER